MREKKRRQEAIKKIVDTYKVSTQKELAEMLKKFGFRVTQATVSRDIGELGLQRVKGRSGIFYSLPGRRVEEEERLFQRISQFVESVAASENLVVVKTLPGAAQGTASALDSIRWEEVVGTVAGDDTILVVIRNRKEAKEVAERLKKIKEEIWV